MGPQQLQLPRAVLCLQSRGRRESQSRALRVYSQGLRVWLKYGFVFLEVLRQLVRSRHTTQYWPQTVRRGETRGVDQQCAQSMHMGSKNVGPTLVIDTVGPILVIHIYPLGNYPYWGSWYSEGPCIDPCSFVITCFTPQHGH